MNDQLFPEPMVGILIFNLHNELFLMKTHKWHGKYGVPGGHIELGETAIETARRETRDEPDLISAISNSCAGRNVSTMNNSGSRGISSLSTSLPEWIKVKSF